MFRIRGLVSLFFLAAGLAFAERTPEYANDLGPSTIDVSSYTAEMQKNYQLFQMKCTFCHTPARAVNSEFIEAKDWSRYIQRMQMRPPCCNRCPYISLKDAKAIYQFLVYDSQVRKTGAQAPAWAAHRADLLRRFQEQYPQLYDRRYAQEKKKEIP